MRIGLFTDTYTPDINGVVSSIVTLKEALEEKGHEVFVITTKNGLISLSYEGNILRVPGIEIKRIYGYKFSTPLQIRAFAHIRNMELDIIHVHTEFGVGVLGHAVGKLLRIPIVSTYHTTYEDYTHYVNTFNFMTIEKLAKKTVVRLSRLFGSSSTIIVAPSTKTKEMLENYGIKREIVVLPTGLDLERFSKANMDLNLVTQYIEKGNLSQDDHVLIFVGRLAKEKSIQFILDGIKEISLIDENIKLVIVGSGPIEEDLKQEVERLEISDYVVFLGKVPSENIPAVYHMADAFISASTSETQGLTYIEAMASGLPILARYDKVISEIVIEGKTGFCFDDQQGLVEATTNFFQLTKDEKLEMTRNATARVQLFDRRNFAERMIEVYLRAQEIYQRPEEDGFIKTDTTLLEFDDFMIEQEELEKKLLEEESQLKLDEAKDETMTEKDELGLLMQDELLAEGYTLCINKISYRDRTRKEMYDLLSERTSLDAKQMNHIIDMLQKQGLINDREFLDNSIASLKDKLMGRHKMILQLRRRGIPAHMIDEHFTEDDVIEETKRGFEAAEQIRLLVHEPSVNGKKDKIRRRMIAKGYDYAVAAHVVANMDFSEEIENEEENCRVFAIKARENLIKRKIKNKVMYRRKLSQAIVKKGFSLDLTRKIVTELEGEFDFENYY